MSAGFDELLLRWSVRAAVGCYLVCVLLEVGIPADQRPPRLGRAIWTVGCLLYLFHVFCAFQFIHDWSHQNAYAHTAQTTRNVVGWNWGGGLYFNYLFTAVWIAETAAWWWRPATRGRHPIYYWGIHFCFAVIVFNATVVFGPMHWRWVAGCVGIALMSLAWWRSGRTTGR